MLFLFAYTFCMGKGVRLYRAEFYGSCPHWQTGGDCFCPSATVVGFWGDLVDACECSHQGCWIEIFDAVTDKQLAGPLAPGERIPRLVR